MEHPTNSQIPTRRQGMSSATLKPSPPKNSNNHLKNKEGVTKSGDPQQQIEITDVVFLRNDHSGNVIKRSKHSFTKR